MKRIVESHKFETCKADYRYKEQQVFLNALASEYGCVAYRPNYHGDSRDANTVLFYTKEDEAHNRYVDKQPMQYTASEAYDRKKYSKVVIPDEYVYRNHFWSFENTDINGRYDLNFALHGRVDLRRTDWKAQLHHRFLLAWHRRMQADYVAKCGGYGFVREADNQYNEYNRLIIGDIVNIHGTAYTGYINKHDGEVEYFREVYDTQSVHNFGCDFVIPSKDEQLEYLIGQWRSETSLPSGTNVLDSIQRRVDSIGGVNFIWF